MQTPKATLSYSEFHHVGLGLLSYSCIISPDLGLSTQVQTAEHLPIAEIFNLERGETFFKVLAVSIVKATAY